jgi:hypothetical protein
MEIQKTKSVHVTLTLHELITLNKILNNYAANMWYNNNNQYFLVNTHVFNTNYATEMHVFHQLRLRILSETKNLH